MPSTRLLAPAAGPLSCGRREVAAGYYKCVGDECRRQGRAQRLARLCGWRKNLWFTVVVSANNVCVRGLCKAVIFRKSTVIYRGRHRGGALFLEKISGFLRFGPRVF